jgi:uncharacterized membrane protein YidH (DUF202 family)
MTTRKFARLIQRQLIDQDKLNLIIEEANRLNIYPEELLLGYGIPKHEILFALAEYYGYPFVEYDEKLTASYLIAIHLNMERHKKELWLPIEIKENTAKIVIYNPERTSVIEEIKQAMCVEQLDILIALPSDLIRIIENSFDVNPGFSQTAGRTPLAKVRTFLANRRSYLSCYRTSLARGRTGLAFLRTGIASIIISLTLFRIFGIGYLLILELPLLIAGVVMVIDGIKWHMGARNTGKTMPACSGTEPTWGTTFLEVSNTEDEPVFKRTAPVPDAANLRAKWNNLSPVMRRRFLASDRTDMAEERTILACYRTIMARARTGLAFARTGIAFIGLGIALFRQFHAGPWTILDFSLIFIGSIMIMEGFYWYFPGRKAGVVALESFKTAGGKATIWDFVFPLPALRKDNITESNFTQPTYIPFVKPSHSPGIWATTGLALERTLLADRRGVMARLRTIMARSRTGLAFIRTGMSIASVGAGLMVYFGTDSLGWTIFNLFLLMIGFIAIADGLYWHLPAERIRKTLPYCFGEMEITMADYGTPARFWSKTTFQQ